MSDRGAERRSLDTAAASSLAVALLVIVSMGASMSVFAGTAAAAGTTDIEVSPATVETTAGETQTFTVTVPNASDGISAYDFNVSVDDPAVAEITSIDDLTGLNDTNVNTDIAADGATANIKAIGADEPAGSVEVIAVTVEFVDTGSTTLNVTANAVGDNTQEVNAYTIDEVTKPTIEVNDVTVKLDPTSQTATVGDNRTYDIVAENVTNGLGFFDLTVSTTDTTVGPITDGEVDAPVGSVTIADDNASAQFGGVYNASASTGPTVTLGTVTVGAEAAGNTNLSLDITVVGDSDGDDYPVVAGSDVTLTVEEADDGDGGDDPSGPSVPSIGDDIGDDLPTTSGTASLNETGSASIDLDGDIRNIGVTVPDATGQLSVEILDALPEGIPEPPQGQLIVVADISAPTPIDGPATVRIQVANSAVSANNADIERLTIVHYVDGEWEALDTSIASEDPLVLEAPVEEFSTFAVVESSTGTPDPGTGTPDPGTGTPDPGTGTPDPGTGTPDPGTGTPDPGTGTPDPGTETPTPTGTPGFGVLIALVAIALVAIALAAGYAVRRNQNSRDE
jgi:PGF-pre-PGF domain-containing protein